LRRELTVLRAVAKVASQVLSVFKKTSLQVSGATLLGNGHVDESCGLQQWKFVVGQALEPAVQC
jgi:hypothetical protein